MVVDGCDNFPTRYLVNDASVFLGEAGGAPLNLPLRGPGDDVPSPGTGPAIAACIPSRRRRGWPRAVRGGGARHAAGDNRLMQATEAIKLMVGVGRTLVGRADVLHMRMKFGELEWRTNTECPVCGDNPTIKEYIDYVEFCSRGTVNA